MIEDILRAATSHYKMRRDELDVWLAENKAIKETIMYQKVLLVREWYNLKIEFLAEILEIFYD
jgi:hypothetical protein